MNSLYETIEALSTAIKTNRVDVLRSILNAYETCEINDEGDIQVKEILVVRADECGTLLHLACKLNSVDAIRTLLSAGADPGVQNESQLAPFDLITDQKAVEVFNEELLRCVSTSNVGRVCQLIAAGVEVNLIDSKESQNTPLHWAASYGNREVLEALTKRGALVNAKNAEGATALHDAISRGHRGVTEALLDAGASVNIRPTSGKFSGKNAFELVKEDQIGMMELVNKHAEFRSDSDDIIDALLETEEAAKKLDSALVLQNGLDTTSDEEELATASHHDLQTDLSNEKVNTLTPPQLNGFTQSVFNYEGVDEQNEPLGVLQNMWPPPRILELSRNEQTHIKLPKDFHIYLDTSNKNLPVHEIVNVIMQKGSHFDSLGLEFSVHMVTRDSNVWKDVDFHEVPSPHILCEVNRRLFTVDESYRLSFQPKQIRIQAADLRGFYYAFTTLIQILRLTKQDGVPPCQIHDWPTFSHRGVLFDISKGRIPKMSLMQNTVILLSMLKVNQIHLYFRFDISQNNSLKLWQSPYSESELLDLDALCRLCFIDLIPVIDVTPNVQLSDLSSLSPAFTKFSSVFVSSKYIGLGPRLSYFLVDSVEVSGELTLAELTAKLFPVDKDRTLLISSTPFTNSSSTLDLSTFPCNAILVEYGVETTHDFIKTSHSYLKSGIPFILMPGTSAWNSLAGCPEAALHNIYSALEAALQTGSHGMVVAHWSGVGHMTHQMFMWPGLIVASGVSWNSKVPSVFVHRMLAELLNYHVVIDNAGLTGHVVVELGRAEAYLIRCANKLSETDKDNLFGKNGSVFYGLLTNPDNVSIENLSLEILQRTIRHLRKCQSYIVEASLECLNASTVKSQLQLTLDLMLTACRIGRSLITAGKNPLPTKPSSTHVNLGISNLSATACTDLANRLLTLTESYNKVWLESNLPSGLPESLITISTLLKQFVPQTVSLNQTA